MQGEKWSPKGEARELIKSKGLRHTSMSVGDVMVVNGKPLLVDSVGFVDLTTGENVSETIHETDSNLVINWVDSSPSTIAFFKKIGLEGNTYQDASVETDTGVEIWYAKVDGKRYRIEPEIQGTGGTFVEEADCSITSKVMDNCPGNEPPVEEEPFDESKSHWHAKWETSTGKKKEAYYSKEKFPTKEDLLKFFKQMYFEENEVEITERNET